MADSFVFSVKATDFSAPVLKGLVSGVSSTASKLASAFAAPLKFISSPRWFGFQAFKSELSGLIGEFKRFYDRGKEDIDAAAGFQKMLGLGADAADKWAWAIKNAAGGTIELADAMRLGSRANAYGVTLKQLIPIMEYVRKFAKATGRDFNEMMENVLLPGPRRAMGLRRAGLLPPRATATNIDMGEIAAIAAQKSKGLDLSGLPPSLTRINAAWNDMIDSIATAVVNSKALQNIVEGIGKFLEAATRYADKFGPSITAAIDKAIPKIKDALIRLGEVMIDVFARVANTISHALGSTGWADVLRFMNNPGRELVLGPSLKDVAKKYRQFMATGGNVGLFDEVDPEKIKKQFRAGLRVLREVMNDPVEMPKEGFLKGLFGDMGGVARKLLGSATEFGARGWEWVERMSKAGKMIAEALKGPLDALRDAYAGLKAAKEKWAEVRMGGLAAEFQWRVGAMPEGSFDRWKLQYSRLRGIMAALRSGRLDQAGMKSALEEGDILGAQSGEVYRLGAPNVRKELFGMFQDRNRAREKVAQAEVDREKAKVKAAKDAVEATQQMADVIRQNANLALGEFAVKAKQAADALPGNEAVEALAHGGF